MTRTRNLVLLLVVASVALILWDLRASDAALRSAAQQVITPLQRTATAMFAPFGQWARDVQAFSEPAARQQTAAPALAAVPAGWGSAVGRVVAADITGERAGVTIDVGRITLIVYICCTVSTGPPFTSTEVGVMPNQPAAMRLLGSSWSGTPLITVLTGVSATRCPPRSTTTRASPVRLALIRPCNWA